MEELKKQRIATGISNLAEALADVGSLESVLKDQVLIEQNGVDNDIYLLVAGSFRVVINGKDAALRSAGDTVGEMATISPIQQRAATIVAKEDGGVLKVSERHFSAIADRFPEVWRRLAQEVSRRLLQRNSLIRPPNENKSLRHLVSRRSTCRKVYRKRLQVRSVCDDRLGKRRFSRNQLHPGVLEEELDRCDFAVAVAHPDDQTQSRDANWPTPRDNVVFELGFFMGRLGRSRAILMEPRETQVKLPSDLAGVTTISYRFDPHEPAASMGVACNELRDHIKRLGRNV